MSIENVTDHLIKAIDSIDYDFIVTNRHLVEDHKQLIFRY